MNVDAGWLFGSLVVSGIGFVLLTYARKMRRIPQGICGVVLMVFPYFVKAWIPMGIIAALALLLLWGVVRLGW